MRLYLFAGLLLAWAALAAPALAGPGDTVAAERERLAAIAALGKLTEDPAVPGRFTARPRAGGDWSLTIIARGPRLRDIYSENIVAHGDARDLTPLLATALGRAYAADYTQAKSAGRTTDGPATTVFKRGRLAGFAVIDDPVNRIHAVNVIAPENFDDYLRSTGTVPASGRGDALYVLDGRLLDPIALVVHGTPRPLDGDALTIATDFALDAAGGTVTLIAGGHDAGTTRTTFKDGHRYAVSVPAGLGNDTAALASPTLHGHPHAYRRTPTAAERSAILAAAAPYFAGSTSGVSVRKIAAIDLDGPAVAATLVRGGRRLFIVVDHPLAAPHVALHNLENLTVTEPLIDEEAEYYVDAVDLGEGTLAIVSRVVGYDAHSYAIYHRSHGVFTLVGGGGGIAL